MKTNQTLFALTAVAGSSVAVAFAPARPQSRPTTDLALGIPKFFLPKGEGDEAAKTEGEEEEKIGLSGLFQLITAGAGAPFLGDYKGVDKETGNFMFSLEANNLVDEEGNSKQTQMPHFENGWVDEDETGFQWPWEKKNKN